MATGGGAAYQKLTVPKDSISANARHAASLSAGNMRQQKALNAQAKRDAARQEQIKAQQKQLRDNDAAKATALDNEDFKTTVTGFDNRDDVARSFSMKAIEGYTNAGLLAREARARGDEKEYQSQLAQQGKIKAQFKNFTNNEENLKKIADHWVKMEREGKLSPVDEEYEQVMQAFADHNFEYKLDENNNPYIQALLTDNEGNETIKRIKASDLVNGNYRPYEKVQVEGKNGLIDNMLTGFGKRVYNEQTGNFSVSGNKWDELNQASLEGQLEGLTGDDRTMSSLLYDASGGKIKKKEGFTEQEVNTVKGFITSKVMAAYDTSEKSTYNGAYEKSRHNKAMEAKGNKGSGAGDQIEVIKNSVTGEPVTQSGQSPQDIQGQAIGFTLETPVEVDDLSISSVYLNNKGEIAYKGKKKTKIENPDTLEEEDGFKEVEGGGLNQEQVSIFARKLTNPDTGKKFKNGFELKKHLKEKVSTKPTAQDLIKKYSK